MQLVRQLLLHSRTPEQCLDVSVLQETLLHDGSVPRQQDRQQHSRVTT